MCKLNALIEQRAAIEQKLAELGFRIEASLSSLDSEGDLDALFSLETGEMVDPPNEQTVALMVEWSSLCSVISATPSTKAKMAKFTVTVTETYTNTFVVEAEDTDQAVDTAEAMSTERTFPVGHVESCTRTIAVAEEN